MFKTKLINVPFVLITLSTILGIILGYFFLFDRKVVLIVFSIFTLILSINWFQSKKIFAKTLSFTVCTILFFMVFGITLMHIHNPKNNSNYYTNQIDPESLLKDKKGIQFWIRERLKPTSYYDKYIVSVELIGTKLVIGKLLLQIPKDTLKSRLNIGEKYTTFAKIHPVPTPLNPYQFDYSKYLAKQYIDHQITVSSNVLVKNKEVRWSLITMADQIRKEINVSLSNYSFSTEQLSIINALLLGQRQDISRETLDNFRDAGALHILAVSGLHVGILLFIINLTLKPFLRIRKHGKLIKLLTSLVLLWCFAIIAGLSPSVLRAVTMFSFLAIGTHMNSQTNTYNSLFVSAFVLLCFDPMLLFSVGFQLSYLAVFSIIWMQPMIAKRFRPRNYISKVLWETFTVTVVAQLGLLPLSLFYFYQFPLLFFMSNLIIIPFLGGVLGFGIIVIVMASIGILPQGIADFFGHCINAMSTIVDWVSKQESFLIRDISFSWRMLFILYAVIIASILLFKKFEKRRIYWVGIPLTLLFITLAYEKHTSMLQEELIIFQNRNKTLLGVLENQQFQLYTDSTITNQTKQFLLKNYLIQRQAKLTRSSSPVRNVYQYKNHTLLIIDSTAIYNIKGIIPDLILLSGSPKIHLGRLLDSLTPKKIIADGSNYRSYLDRWEKTCIQKNIPFYRTDKKGAYILK